MKSSSTIRTCSVIMMIITIICAIGGGLVVSEKNNSIILMFLIWIFGIFAAIMQNALFQGFADIIDNTYASACKANDIEVPSKREGETGQVSFQRPSRVEKVEKSIYAKELLSKGLINQEEYDEMIKKEDL